MTLQEIITILTGPVGGIGVFILLAYLIKIKPIELNIFQLIGNELFKSVNTRIDLLENSVASLDKKIDLVKGDLEDHVNQDQIDKVTQKRLRILRFSSDLLHNVKPTKEHEESVIDDIDVYEDYCLKHPTYSNNKALMSIKQIKKDYENRLLHNDFLE